MPTEYVVHAKHEGSIAASFRNVVVTYWRTAANVPVVDAARRAFMGAMKSHAGAAVYMNVTDVGTPVPNDVRDVWMRMMHEADEGGARAAAVVTTIGGFTGSIVRGVTTGMLLVARPKLPIKVFDSIDTAARFLEASYAKGARGATASEIVAGFEAIRGASA